MLALAKHVGAPTETYDDCRIRFSRWSRKPSPIFPGVPVKDIAIGTDGCGVPVCSVFQFTRWP